MRFPGSTNSRKFMFLALGLTAIVTLVAVPTLTILNKSVVHVPESVSESADFAVVVPGHVPKDSYVASPPAFEAGEKVVVTSFKTSTGADIVISQQKKPDIDLRQIDAKETYLAPIGSVYILKGEAGQIRAIIETEDSRIMVNCDQPIGTVACKAVISNLRAKD